MSKEQAFRSIFRLLQIATIGVFVGRGLQHLCFGAPYRTLLWDEAWMSWLIEGGLFDLSWSDYVTNAGVDQGITAFTKGVGIFYLICALVALLLKKLPRFLHYLLLLGAVSLVFLAFLYCKERFFQAGQFLEYSLQFTAPIFLYLFYKESDSSQLSISESLLRYLKIAIATTFICHGLYAVGYYPRPGHFMDMVLNILNLEETQVKQFLLFVGIMDFIAAVLLFFPRKIALLAAAYITFWGFMTTIARVWAYFQSDFWQETLLRWLPESVMRFPHFLIPLAVLIWLIRAVHVMRQQV
ncbi:MAG: hypothetical protein AAF849_02385 [Bacteroidota bacterium]